MEFTAQHSIAQVGLPDFEALYFDESMGEALCASVRLQRQLISRRVDAGVLHRAVRVCPQREIPKPLARILGKSQLAYTEHVTYPIGSMAGTWHLTFEILADKLRCAGTFCFAADGPNVVRTVQGTVEVKIFGVGALAERLIVAEVQRGYADAAAFTQAYLQQHPPGTFVRLQPAGTDTL
jgi:hypothetical protein